MQPFMHERPAQTHVKIAGAGVSCYREIMQTEMCHLEHKTKRSEKAKRDKRSGNICIFNMYWSSREILGEILAFSPVGFHLISNYNQGQTALSHSHHTLELFLFLTLMKCRIGLSALQSPTGYLRNLPVVWSPLTWFVLIDWCVAATPCAVIWRRGANKWCCQHAHNDMILCNAVTFSTESSWDSWECPTEARRSVIIDN